MIGPRPRREATLLAREQAWALLRADASACVLTLHRADTFLDRLCGLLGAPVPQPGHGLWLTPCSAVHSFGMRAPIDLLFLDERHRVVAVRACLPPWRLASCRAARSTIEMRAGEASRLGIAPGSRLGLSISPAAGAASRRPLPPATDSVST